jgi:hypothetical protein
MEHYLCFLAGFVAGQLFAQPSLAQGYVHGVLARFRPQQEAINECMHLYPPGQAFQDCMLDKGYLFCSNCRILGISGKFCASVPGATTSAPCYTGANVSRSFQ